MISGQANIIFQADPGFHSLYSGPNSFINRGEYKTSLVGTIYTGFQVRSNPHSSTELLLDIESAGGRGLGNALGVAGFTNLDVVRNPSLGSSPYIARAEIHQTIGLTDKMVEAQRTTTSLSTLVPERRIELRAGKLSTADLFDNNGVGTDSHLQFMNWTVDNNGSYDYAADTRGYTYGAFGEYDDKVWSVRYMLALMPTVANGLDLDWNVRRASGQNVEFELRKAPLGLLLKKSRGGVIRALSFVNHANMGLYADAIKAYESGADKTPNILLHERLGSVKYGFGLNAEQSLSENVRGFVRFGWNEGQHETWAYTEVDQTAAAGMDYAGSAWKRPLDKIGAAVVSNAISHEHMEYLKLGGLGFLLGDGNLNYGRENIAEAYYNLHAWRGAYYSFDTQAVENPGYNKDRGPFVVFSVRMHVDF
ncbi:Carbohydrate-selective porin [Granulicella sibirica]|uniref:Carbohydrate-selective porin n=2 Tax=Granulicella sibirica TaxID=2479048 RepID=A0A4Q0SW59_9BACT|nr:Carbohydrate-selective porin [Granulicella sibirica]